MKSKYYFQIALKFISCRYEHRCIIWLELLIGYFTHNRIQTLKYEVLRKRAAFSRTVWGAAVHPGRESTALGATLVTVVSLPQHLIGMPVDHENFQNQEHLNLVGFFLLSWVISPGSQHMELSHLHLEHVSQFVLARNILSDQKKGKYC